MTIKQLDTDDHNKGDQEGMNKYERRACGASGMDVLGAWAVAAAVLLGLMVLSDF